MNMLSCRVASERAPRTSSGQPHHRTTGVASANWAQGPPVAPLRLAGSQPAIPAIASAKSGAVSASETRKRRRMSRSSGSSPSRRHRHRRLEGHAAARAGRRAPGSRRPGTSGRHRASRPAAAPCDRRHCLAPLPPAWQQSCPALPRPVLRLLVAAIVQQAPQLRAWRLRVAAILPGPVFQPVPWLRRGNNRVSGRSCG